MKSNGIDTSVDHWVTIRGVHVYISGKNGTILKGPKRLMGKDMDSADKILAKEEQKKKSRGSSVKSVKKTGKSTTKSTTKGTSSPKKRPTTTAELDKALKDKRNKSDYTSNDAKIMAKGKESAKLQKTVEKKYGIKKGGKSNKPRLNTETTRGRRDSGKASAIEEIARASHSGNWGLAGTFSRISHTGKKMPKRIVPVRDNKGNISYQIHW